MVKDKTVISTPPISVTAHNGIESQKPTLLMASINSCGSDTLLIPELPDGEVKELQLTTQCYAFARVLDGKACVVVLNNGDSPAQLEFQLPVEASSAKDLLADTVGAQPVLTSMEWGRMKVQLPSNYATILQLEK